MIAPPDVDYQLPRMDRTPEIVVVIAGFGGSAASICPHLAAFPGWQLEKQNGTRWEAGNCRRYVLIQQSDK